MFIQILPFYTSHNTKKLYLKRNWKTLSKNPNHHATSLWTKLVTASFNTKKMKRMKLIS